MNCIFCCVFNQEKYIDIFYLFLESLLIYGKLDDNTNLLVYTSTLFMNIIKENTLFNPNKIFFEINDTYDDINKACKAKLNLFNLSFIENYEKILYLDIDIFVKDDINKVFEVCQDDILYVLEEGQIDSDTDYWGKILFGNEIRKYNDKSGFTCGILLFNNCEKIKDLFNKINEDIIERPYNFNNYDQPYIVYNAFKYNLYNNKILKSLVVNNDDNIHSNKVIHHFPQKQGIYEHKINALNNYLYRINDYNYIKNIYTLNIEDDIQTCSVKIRYDIYDFFKNKKNLKIAEIGSYKGYSTKILSKIFDKVYAIDNNIEWINFNKIFNEDATNIEYIMLDVYADSWEILPDDIEVSFIDADHTYDCCKSDILNSIKYFKNLKYIVFNNYDVYTSVNKIINEFLDDKTLNFERFIGLNDVPGLNGIIKNINEGIICSIN